MSGTKKFGEENYIANGMGIPAYDYISNSYSPDGSLIEVTYRLGGSSGDIVAVLEMTYDGDGNVLTVERTT